MRTTLRIGLAVAGLVLVVGGGIAAVSPYTVEWRVDHLVVDWDSLRANEIPANRAGLVVGRKHVRPGLPAVAGRYGRAAIAPRTDVRMDLPESMTRREAIIIASRQELREQFRVWGVQAQILGLLLLIAAGLSGRRWVHVCPNRTATTPVAPTAPTPPTPPVDPDWTRVEPPTEPAQPLPAAVRSSAPPVDETGGDLDPAPQPEPPALAAEAEADPAAPLAELTVRVTRTDGSVELVEIGGPKVVEVNQLTVVVARTITVDMDCRD